MYPVAILAGGLATRLHPITKAMPKALIEVAGKPFVHHQLQYLRNQGITHVVLCLGHLGEMIRDVVGGGDEFGLDVSYSEDGPSPLGTGGALRKALPLLGNHFFVIYGDSYLQVNFSNVMLAYQNRGLPAMMTVMKNENKWDKSNVNFSKGNLIMYDKRKPSSDMCHIDYGLGVISASVLKGYSCGQSFDLADLYHELASEGKMSGYEVNERFYEIGSHAGLRETLAHFTGKVTT